jgi:ribosomal protein S27AE
MSENIQTTTPNKTRMKKIDPVCQICYEKNNKSTHIPIKCLYCAFEACRKCCETYAINESILKCMNGSCGKEWTRKFIRDSFTLVFINGPLKQHREQLLFERERALLPATQPIIEQKIACARIDETIKQLYEEVTKINKQINTLHIEKNSILKNKRRTDRAIFVRACPDEDCRGFLSNQWKCGICEKWTCPDCHIIKGYTRDAEHTCNPDDVATAQLLTNDTKPCPRCSTGIFKIDGCDQMWCTQCHTAFSWRTGVIQHNIHNPHYYEWLRRNNGGEAPPRNPGDIPCGREMNHILYENISRAIRTKHLLSPLAKNCLSKCDDIIRRTIHLNYVERPNLQVYERRNEDLRVKYLMKEISEDDMKIQLQRDDKRHNKMQELFDIFQIVSTTVTDIMYRFLHYLENDAPREYPENGFTMDILNEINQIVEYANECLQEISHTYSCSRIVFGPTLRLYKGVHAEQYLATNKTNAV